VNEVVNSGTADVHPDVLRIDGFEGGFSSACTVREKQFSHYQPMYHAVQSPR
jgi:hypothetical protein